jgi:RimJ/RimL family protein N-acetyltransferase
VGILLQSERLRLREFTGDDVDLLVDLDSDPDVMHFITGGRATPREEIAGDVLPRWLRYYRESPGLGFWAAEDGSGRFLGWFHLRPGAGHGPEEPELGYRFKRDAWGQGYATEGSRALIDCAFTTMPIDRVLAETMAVHTASRRVMEKCGMSLRRAFLADWPDRIPGDEFGDVEYVLERHDWQRR